MKQKLWRAIEAYRSSGGREEHWRNRDVLDILIDEILDKSEALKAAYDVWQDKTEWVQETATPRELGMHRADVLKDRIALLKTRCDDLEAEAQRLSDHATALREIAGRRGKSVMPELVELANENVALRARVLELENIKRLVMRSHAAKGRYHTQIATCDLYDACGLANTRP